MAPHSNYKLKVKEQLRNEINNQALQLQREREKRKQTPRNWFKPASIEAMERNFNESTRYYNLFPEKREHGLKFIPPPKQENIQQYHEHEEFAKSRNKMESTLLNDNYSSKYVALSQRGRYKDKSPRNVDGVDVKSFLSPEVQK